VKLAEFFGLFSQSKYSNLKDFGRKMFSIFASTYICEQTFSLMKRNKLTHILGHVTSVNLTNPESGNR
jgi:hypothetical protein